MYTNFYGLNEKPFSITPDPRYLFLSGRHSEGLAHLVYAVKDSSGFIQLTGEVGTGKTTLVRTLLTRIPAGIEVAMVLNPQLTAIEFLAAICEELKVPLPEDRHSSKELVDTLNRHLLAGHANGRRTILIIDEAQNLATEVLEQVRLLTNLETAKQKLLQIILIAQPELRDKLSQTNLRQLAQRITGRYHLEPLTREETAAYIDHRMKVAGGLVEIFDDGAKREVFKLSGGVPRLVNVICDRALLGAYSREIRRITPQLVREAAKEVSGESAKSGARWLMPAAAVLTSVVVGLGIWGIWGANNRTTNAEPLITSTPITNAPLDVEVPAAAPDTPEPAIEVPVRPSLNERLLELDEVAAVSSAMSVLLSLWGVEMNPDGAAPCDQAAAAGLQCISQRGSFGVLRQLDRPVLLTLTDSSGRQHPSVLVSLRDGVAELRIGDQNIEASTTEILDLWYGQYLLVWQPPNGDPSTLQPGTRSPKVLWLRQSLSALDASAPISPSNSDLFDDELAQRLMEFQRKNRLDADGLAGHQTQIMINSQLRLAGTPTLSGA